MKKITVGILAHVFVKNSKYLKSVVDTSVTECDEIVIGIDNLSTKRTNAVATNLTCTVSVSYYSKKASDCYILHTVLLAIILLVIITIICYHCAKQKVIIRRKITWKYLICDISYKTLTEPKHLQIL